MEDVKIGPKTKDVTGQVFGRLTITGYAGKDKWRKSCWHYECECGRTGIATVSNLTSGKVASCGHHGPGATPKEIVTYQSAHRRVYNLKGKASDHPCSNEGCDSQAAEWAYDNTDPDELTGLVRGYEIKYSLSPEHYCPMCHSCHRAFDKMARELPQTEGVHKSTPTSITRTGE